MTEQPVSAVGQSIGNVEGRLKVTGGARYAADIAVRGELRVAAVRSIYPHARILNIETSAAAQLPGVVVLTRDDIAEYPRFGPVIEDETIVATDRVRFVGDIVAAVAAPDIATARAAVALIDVDYEVLPAVLDATQANSEDAVEIHPELRAVQAEAMAASIQPGLDLLEAVDEKNLCARHHFRAGDVASAFERAYRVYRSTYSLPTIQHAHIEPHAVLAYWEGSDRLVVSCATQDPYTARSELARLFSLSPGSVRVVAPYVGGGFGGKLYPRIEAVAAALSRKAGQPVKWVLTREEVFRTIVRHAAVVRIESAVLQDGSIIGRRMAVTYDAGAYAEISPRVAAQNGAVACGPYRIPNVDVDLKCFYTNKPTAGAFRGFGVPQVNWASESQMDEIAADLGIDPLELRLRNVFRDGDLFMTGETLSGVSVAECLGAVSDAIGWATRDVPPAPGPYRRGKGVACTAKSTMTPSTSTATVRLDADGSARLLTSSVEIGQGSTTALAQLVADEIGLGFDAVHVSSADTDVTPFDHGTKSSRVTYSVGNAAIKAARSVRAQVIELASKALDVPPTELVVCRGSVGIPGVPQCTLTVPEVFKATVGLPVGSIVGHGSFTSTGGLDARTGRGKDTAFWMSSAVAAEVEVDTETGKVQVLRLVAATDPGRAINPRMCHMQNEGAMLMGLGSALIEELVFEEGQPLNGSFLNYAIPSAKDYPSELQSIILERPQEDGPRGARGIGEAAMVPVAAAIANAVARALDGVRVRDLPLTAERVVTEYERRRVS
jgi:CO/xanthine dehydrogenase Mo-binding subunit